MDRQPQTVLMFCACTNHDLVIGRRSHSGKRIGYGCNVCGSFKPGEPQYNFEGWHIAVDGNTAIARLLNPGVDFRVRQEKDTSELAIAAIEASVKDFNEAQAKLQAAN